MAEVVDLVMVMEEEKQPLNAGFCMFFCCCDIDAFLHGMFDPKDHKINT